MSEPENTVPNTVPGKNGGRLRVGNPGNKGGGRQPEWFKELCRDMIASPKARKSVTLILANPDHPHFASMWKAVSDRGYGKPEQPINHGAQAGTAMTFTMNLGAATVHDDG
jgi:hypothetical protein